MNRLEKLKKEKLEQFKIKYGTYNLGALNGFDSGFDVCSAEYEKIIAELEKDLKAIISAHKSGCVQYKGCDCWWQYAEKALQKLKEFRG